MPIHPSIHNYENTLANAAAWYFGQKGENFVYRCINRLDRDTTGLLILAKNRLSGALLSRMSAERKIHRQYLAIATGEIPKCGTIDAPIARACDSAIACLNLTVFILMCFYSWKRDVRIRSGFI